MSTSFPISNHEKWAVSLATVILLAGVAIAWFHGPSWINRSGSLVIVVGVLLAISRLADLTETNVSELMNAHFENGMQRAVQDIEATHGHVLTPAQREALGQGVRSSMSRGFSAMFEDWRIRVKRFEVSLVIVGTLVNGFGDWLFCLAVTCKAAA
ncbi:MAG: hypothetical protein A3H93_04830 [Rhodocyclales bacterium RIFCSPLOWO2_02_FULL_63_24]|nr:MAG: hypothetical protein A3H93_04830 [Rhodocyclales bacterium RIFCSPLOWO2_02_FULL_63_24]